MTTKSLLGILMLATRASAMDVVACNQTVPTRETGVLRADLVCTGAYAVFLSSGATLLMNGHTLTGPSDEDVDSDGVGCLDTCTVIGPGEISGFEEGIVTNDRLVRVSDVVIHDCGVGIKAPTLRLTNVTASNNSEVGFTAVRLKGTGITADDNGGYGFYGFRLAGKNIAMSRNALDAIQAHERFHATTVTLRDNGGAGVVSGRVSVSEAVVTGNAGGGVYGTAVAVRDGELSGNGPFDLASTKEPHLVRTTCGTSLRWMAVPFPQSWGVCTLD